VSRGRGHASDEADRAFAALADPTRRAILQLVVDEGPVTATAVSAQLPISRQGVAKHLGVLRDAGLVRAERAGRETRFEASLEPLDAVAAWVDEVGTAWDRRFARLAEQVRRR
jgi:DNA-binding transcriptional ArsR family regulator